MVLSSLMCPLVVDIKEDVPKNVGNQTALTFIVHWDISPNIFSGVQQKTDMRGLNERMIALTQEQTNKAEVRNGSNNDKPKSNYIFKVIWVKILILNNIIFVFQ